MAEIQFNRQFQEEDVPWLIDHPKSMILYDPRLGKTVVTCRAVMGDPKSRVILINCSKNALSVWIDHLKSWWKHLRPGEPLEIRLVRGKHSKAAQQRQELWSRPITGVTVFLCTFEAFYYDWKYIQEIGMHKRFDTMILDEVHRKLRSHKTKSRDIYKHLARTCHRTHYLSGTLAGKWGPGDFWSIVNLIAPSEYGSYWAWVNSFCIVEDNGFGKQIIGTKNMDGFWLAMRRYARIRKRDIEMPNMPKVQRNVLWVEPSKEVLKLYREIGGQSKETGNSMYTFLPNGEIVVAANSLESAVRRRQLLTCPAILDPSLGVGAAFEHLVESMEEARDDGDLYGHHVVIFSAFRRALDPFANYLRQHGFHVGLLVGGTEPEDVVRISNEFRRTQGVILCTTMFAQAFSLVPARSCFHIGWDFAPDNNKQAEDRLVPQSGDFHIDSWYYAYTGTDDEDLIDHITAKSMLIYESSTPPDMRGS